MRIAVIQLGAIGISTDALSAYMRTCSRERVSLVLLGEYILNRFFKELQKTPIAMIKEQSEKHLLALKEMAVEYNLTIVAPLIIVKSQKIYKHIVRITPTRVHHYKQQLLINYKHWNEEAFFDNEIAALKAPMIFKAGKFRFAVMGGFELHFDPLWSAIDAKDVDVVLLPTLSTFASHERWKKLIEMRAFTHSCYIVRANRIGTYNDKGIDWEFYGDSLAVSPEGEMIEHLGNYEEILIVDIDKEQLKASKSWGFKEAIKRRASL